MEPKAVWRNHPLAQAGSVELIPTEWVAKYRGVNVRPQADTLAGTIVDLDTFWQYLCQNGLADPLIMRVGLKSQTFRLEAGNHRIQVLEKHNVSHVPLTVQVTEYCGPGAPDPMNIDSHNFPVRNDLLIDVRTSEYMKPSDVFKSLRASRTP